MVIFGEKNGVSGSKESKRKYSVFQLLYTLYGDDCECVGKGDGDYSN